MPETDGSGYRAVAFDLLTALLDSWSSWADAARDPALALRWRLRYLELTYGAGRYRDYAALIRESAEASGVGGDATDRLLRSWGALAPWPETSAVLRSLAERVPLAVVTNCSDALAAPLVAKLGVPLRAVITAEAAGWYKPHPEPYRLAIEALGEPASRILFVAGSPNDIGGAGGVGLPVFWHNRLGLPLPPTTASPIGTAASLAPLLELVTDAGGSAVKPPRSGQRTPKP
ncbi:MAG: HAD-IA family hydrolase [Gemmatimonadales bacterium]